MKSNYVKIACLAALLAATGASQAANLYWDPVPATAGPNDGAGSWGNGGGNVNWWDGAANVPWNPGDIAVIGVNSNIAVTVTVTNPVVAGGILISNLGVGAYTLATPGGNRTSIPVAAATNIAFTGASPAVIVGGQTITNAQTIHTINASVVAPNGLRVLADTPATNSFLRFGHITNYIGGDLQVGTPGTATYGGLTSLYCDFNTPTSTDAYASIINGATNLTVYSNATVRISNHNSGSPTTVQWPKRMTISGFGRNGVAGAWIITGNVGDNFVADVVLAGDSLIDMNVGAANKVFTLYGVLSGSGNLTVVSANSTANRQTLVLTNASTLVGNFTIGGGSTLQLINGDNRLPATAALKLGISSGPVANWNAYGRLLLGNAARAVSQTLAGLSTDSPDGLCRVFGGNSTNISWLTVNSAVSNYYAGTIGGTTVNDKNIGLVFNGGGTLTLAGTNVANGGYTLNSGMLEFGDGLNDFPLAGPITNNGTVIIGVGSALTYADTLTGTGAVIKRGAGTATLSGVASYAGSTTVEAGKLSLLTTKTGTGSITVGLGGGLEVKRTTPTGAISASTTTLDNAQVTFNFNNKPLSATAPLTVTGQFANSGSTLIYIAAPGGLAVGSFPLIKYGTHQSNDFSSLALGTPISPRVAAAIQNNPANQSIDLVITSVDYLDWTGATDGTWDTTTTNWILSSSAVATAYTSGDFARLTDSATGTTTLTVAFDPQPGVVLVTNQAKNYTIGASFGGIGGTGALVKQGTGSLTITAPVNTYSGGTIIQGGTLTAGDGTTDAQLPDGIDNNASLVFNVAALNSANSIIGTGALSKTGPGTLTLGGTSTYSGATTVSAGTLKVASSSALGATSGATTVSPGAEVWVDAPGLTIPEPLTLSGNGTAGVGALVASSGASTWSGPIQVLSDSTMGALSGAALTLSGGIDATNRNLVFNADNTGHLVVASTLPAASVTLTNTGGLILAAANPGLTNLQNLSPVTYGAGPPITSGLWARHDQAFGTNLTVVITNGNHIGDTGTQLGLDNNVSIPATVALRAYCPGDGLEGQGGGYRCSLSVRTSTTNTWNGPITIHGPDPLLGITSLFILNGGNSGTSGRLVVNGDITIVDGPVNLFPRGWNSGQFNGRLNLGTNYLDEADGARWTIASTGNTWREARVGSSTAILALGANNALCTTAPLKLEGRFELDGFNQEIAGLYSATATGVIVNHSTNAHSTLTIRATNSLTYGGALLLSGVFGSKQFGLDIASGGLTLTNNANSYAGPTVIRSGATLALFDNGDIQTSDIEVQVGGTFDVSGRSATINNPLIPAGYGYLRTDQALTGNGTVTGSITNTGTIAPGSSVGTLTVSTDVGLGASGQVWMEVNNTTATSDLLSVGGTLTYGGTLVVSNVSATAYTNNQVIKLFNAASYAGSFASIVFPGISYDASQLTVDGTIKVMGTVPLTPTNITVSVSGGNMTLSWPASYTGWRLEAQTNSLSTGLSNNWATVPGSTSVNSVVVPLNPANGTVFYRLVYP